MKATVVHGASLLVGAVVILSLQTTQWFHLDEWAFLKIDGPGLLVPHDGHWSTSPLLIFEWFRDLFGVDNYFPFAALVTVFHLATAHLLWRVIIRAGVRPWLATTTVFVFVFLGAGEENILWAFQIGYVGALGLGLLAFHLASSTVLSAGRMLAVVAVSLFSLTWSGTALPMVAATAGVLLYRHGWKRAAVFGAIVIGVFLAWFVAFGSHTPPSQDSGGFAPHKIFVAMPEFFALMFGATAQKLFGVPGLGPLIALAVIIWLCTVFVRRRGIAELFPGLALLGGAVIFAILTAYSRAVLSIDSAASSRYIYTVVLLLAPILALALERLVRNRRGALVTALAGLVVLGCYQGVTLGIAAAQASVTEQRSHRLLSAALQEYLKYPARVALGTEPDPKLAPDLQMHDLVALHSAGYFQVGPFTPADTAQARKNIEPSTN